MKTLLDVGCGDNSPIKNFSSRLHTTGVDAFAPSIDNSKKKGIHNEYYLMDILAINEKFKPGSFDVVIACDVIEHVTKENGWILMEHMELIASKKIIFYTPNGFLKQGDRFNNPWQVHHSGWTAKEFEDRGYEVIGINGVKPLRGEFAKVKYKPQFLWNFISDITELFVKRNPEKAFQLLAIKTKTSA